MNPEIVNIYIEVLLKEIESLTKNRLLLETQLKYTEALNSELNKKISNLESEVQRNSKKLNKTKEVNTSEIF